jgi:hypothetical protein
MKEVRARVSAEEKRATVWPVEAHSQKIDCRSLGKPERIPLELLFGNAETAIPYHGQRYRSSVRGFATSGNRRNISPRGLSADADLSRRPDPVFGAPIRPEKAGRHRPI